MKQILVYDGECNMCSRFIKFIVFVNKNPNIFITDFNSDWYKSATNYTKRDSIIFISDDKEYLYSEAIIYLLFNTNKYFKPIILLKWVPRRERKIVCVNR